MAKCLALKKDPKITAILNELANDNTHMQQLLNETEDFVVPKITGLRNF